MKYFVAAIILLSSSVSADESINKKSAIDLIKSNNFMSKDINVLEALDERRIDSKRTAVGVKFTLTKKAIVLFEEGKEPRLIYEEELYKEKPQH